MKNVIIQQITKSIESGELQTSQRTKIMQMIVVKHRKQIDNAVLSLSLTVEYARFHLGIKKRSWSFFL